MCHGHWRHQHTPHSKMLTCNTIKMNEYGLICGCGGNGQFGVSNLNCCSYYSDYYTDVHYHSLVKRQPAKHNECKIFNSSFGFLSPSSPSPNKITLLVFIYPNVWIVLNGIACYIFGMAVNGTWGRFRINDINAQSFENQMDSWIIFIQSMQKPYSKSSREIPNKAYILSDAFSSDSWHMLLTIFFVERKVHLWA